jgi:N-acetylglucosamine-6-phosphate deacetylase
VSRDRHRLAIRNGTVLLPSGAMERADLTVVDGRIEFIGPAASADEDIDAAGCSVLPGLIDLHTHGLGYESAASETLREYARLEAAHGATTFYPTLFGPPEQSARHLERHRRPGAGLADLPQVGGFRLESPYLARTGAGTSRDLRPISDATTDRLLEAGGGLVKIWDVSPELPGAPRLVRRLADAGIRCSIAHTQATIEQARAVVDAGAALVTHLFDTFDVPPMTDPGVYPTGLVDYLLVEDRIACEIIGDGTHAAPLLVEIALRCKSADRIAWITDSNFGAGLPPGEYQSPEWGLIVISDPNRGARLRDRGMLLAGSALTPIDGLRNAVQLFGQNLATASRLCSGTPARLMGLHKGVIEPGFDADLIVLDDELGLVATIAAGRIVYRR